MAFLPELYKKQFLFYRRSILKMSGNWDKYKSIFLYGRASKLVKAAFCVRVS